MVGRRSKRAAGAGTTRSATPGSATKPGAGCPITTAAGRARTISAGFGFRRHRRYSSPATSTGCAARSFAGWGPLAPGEDWSPSAAPQQFLNVNTTYATFLQDAQVIDPAGFQDRPKEPLGVAVFALALPSPAFPASRLEAVRPMLRVGYTHVSPVIPGTTFQDSNDVPPPPQQPAMPPATVENPASNAPPVVTPGPPGPGTAGTADAGNLSGSGVHRHRSAESAGAPRLLAAKSKLAAAQSNQQYGRKNVEHQFLANHAAAFAPAIRRAAENGDDQAAGTSATRTSVTSLTNVAGSPRINAHDAAGNSASRTASTDFAAPDGAQQSARPDSQGRSAGTP